MVRNVLRSTFFFVVLTIWMLPSSQAQQKTASDGARRIPARFPANAHSVQRVPQHASQQWRPRNVRNAVLGQNGRVVTIGRQPAQTGTANAPAYPYLNAPLYTSPRQNIPHQLGAAVHTNQAFAPHEMLHEHKYEAMYPPYYYKVHGHWFVTPWGVWSAEDWQLQGTKVTVDYRSRKPFFSLFTDPWLH